MTFQVASRRAGNFLLPSCFAWCNYAVCLLSDHSKPQVATEAGRPWRVILLSGWCDPKQCRAIHLATGWPQELPEESRRRGSNRHRVLTPEFSTRITPDIFSMTGYQGHPTDRFGKVSVRKALNPLQFSKGNFHLELS